MIRIRALNPLLPLACLALGILLAFAIPAGAGEVGPEAFLGPAPGVRYTFSDGKKMTLWRRGLEKQLQGVAYEEEICCFGPYSEDGAVSVDRRKGMEMVPITERRSIKTRHALVADGPRLVLKTPDIELTLFDASRDEWQVPLLGSPGTPREATCRVVSKERTPYRGEDRLLVVVACTASRQGKIVYETAWTLASGLGVIALDDFKLVSAEKTDAAPQGRE